MLWAMRPSPVMKWLILGNIGVFILQKILVQCGWSGFEGYLCLSPGEVSQGYAWQFITYMFLHADASHLLINVMMLLIFGNEVEEALGAQLTLRLYFAGGLAGGIFWYTFNAGQSNEALIGASGAIYAIVTGFGTLYPNRPFSFYILVLPVSVLGKYLALAAVVLSVLFSVGAESGGVAHLAHLGGIVVGYFLVKSLVAPIQLPQLSWPRKHASVEAEPLRQVSASPLKTDDFMKLRIDPILEKIAEHGIQSLSREERELLDEAKDRLS